MRLFPSFCLLLSLVLSGVAFAQDVRIVYPQEGQNVRGEITARFEGIPAGGYARLNIDGQFQQASAQDFAVFDTISDRVTFTHGDGGYKLELIVFNAGGKRVGTDTVTFNVANSVVETGGDAVKLVHWTPADRLGDVQRYRVFGEANASISGGAVAGAAAPAAPAAGGAGAGGADASGSAGYLPAPLDWQVTALMRRVVRDTGLLDGAANISTIVQEGFQRQRLTAPVTPDEIKSANGLSKGPWAHDFSKNAVWDPAPETGKYFIKMIQQNGTEINATRKAASVAIADLLPTFPDVPVRPGSTWETTMSFVGDLSSRLPINVRAPITFTAYETLQTPAGENRRCAKLESRFRLPDNLAKRIAANLANKSGQATGGGATSAPGPVMPGGGGAGADASTGLTENDIEVARTDMARVLWFDIENRRILRAEDVIQSNFEIPVIAPAGGAGPAPAAAPAAGAAPTEPTKIGYNLKVTTWMDDRIPNPTGRYVSGGANAHSRDSVSEPGLSRILSSKASTP